MSREAARAPHTAAAARCSSFQRSGERDGGDLEDTHSSREDSETKTRKDKEDSKSSSGCLTMDGYGRTEDELFSSCLVNLTWETCYEQVGCHCPPLSSHPIASNQPETPGLTSSTSPKSGGGGDKFWSEAKSRCNSWKFILWMRCVFSFKIRGEVRGSAGLMNPETSLHYR